MSWDMVLSYLQKRYDAKNHPARTWVEALLHVVQYFRIFKKYGLDMVGLYCSPT